MGISRQSIAFRNIRHLNLDVFQHFYFVFARFSTHANGRRLHRYVKALTKSVFKEILDSFSRDLNTALSCVKILSSYRIVSRVGFISQYFF